MKCPDLKQLVLLIFEMIKKWSPTARAAKTRMLCNMKQYMKTRYEMKRMLAFHWLIVFVTMTTPIFSTMMKWISY